MFVASWAARLKKKYSGKAQPGLRQPGLFREAAKRYPRVAPKVEGEGCASPGCLGRPQSATLGSAAKLKERGKVLTLGVGPGAPRVVPWPQQALP